MRDMLCNEIDLIVLDINLPGEDGLMLTRELSQSDIGIIKTGRTDSIDKLLGSKWGPTTMLPSLSNYASFLSSQEFVVANVSSKWRFLFEMSGKQNENLVRFGDWVFDIQRRALSNDGDPVKLTKAEYELLVALSSHPNQVLSRERILNMISHRVDAPNDRTIDVLIRRMRAKMEFDPKNPQIL